MTPQIYIGLNESKRNAYLIDNNNKSIVIINKICSLFGTDYEEVLSKSRNGDLPTIRHLICYFLTIKANLSFREVAYKLGVDRTTVYFAIDKVKNRQFDRILSEMYDRVERQIENI